MDDASVSLPLLEGLYHRRGAAQSVCRDAYRRHDAARRIASWVSTHYRRRKTQAVAGSNRNKRRKVVPKIEPPPMLALSSATSSQNTWEHWIFRAIRSNSLAVRKVAYGILLKGTPARHELRDMMLGQVNLHLGESSPNDYAIQLVALLTHLLVQKSDDLVAFCAGGGLRWISRAILTLTGGLFPIVTALSGMEQSHNVEARPYGSFVMIQTRLALLVDLCYRLVLFASIPTAKNKTTKEEEVRKEVLTKRLQALQRTHNSLWTSDIPAVSVDGATLTPLACLICAFEVLRSIHPLPAKIRGMSACLAMLGRLVDPTATAMVTTTSKTDRTKRKQRKQQHRDRDMESLLFPQSSSEEERPSSAATAMARAVSAAMDALEHPNAEADMDGDVIMEDIEDGNEEGEEGQDGNTEADDEATQEQDEDDDDEEEFVEEGGEEEDDDEEELDSDECDEDIEGEEHEEEEEHDIIIDDEDDDLSVDLDAMEQSEQTADTENLDGAASTACISTEKDRMRTYVSAGMQVLSAHYRHTHTHAGSPSSGAAVQQGPSHLSKYGNTLHPLLSLQAELSLLKSICDVVKPPRKPLKLKMFLKRAPTQEEFFRGSLSRNPISLSSLARSSRGSHGGSSEPTVRDLRQHIAKDLQMSDSAELLELLVANKILDMNLKLRVVQQVLWKNHLMENNSSSFVSSLLSGHSGHAFFSSGGSGISMMLSSSLGGGERGGSGSRRNISADTPASALPPMVVTYRLAGVDGEATEDHVDEASLADPEAPSPSESPEAHERQMEKEYGITRLVTEGRGISVLLGSIESHVTDTLRRIRRDDVALKHGRGGRNPSRDKFLKSAPSPGLVLLRHCSKLAYNRKKLLEARAPTVLLRLLLDVLNALEEPSGSGESFATSNAHSVSSPTADVLKELIELLASDISPSTLLTAAADRDEFEANTDQDASTLPLLLSSLRTTFLSPPLRKVIGKLLPFLTYGQVALSRELAENIAKHITVDSISEAQSDDKSTSQVSVLVDTFVQATINLPPNEICNSLRMELINCGFVERVAGFCTKDIPMQPPPWTAALRTKEQARDLSKHAKQRKSLEEEWRSYFERSGLRTAFRMLTGLCAGHAPTQSLISNFGVAKKKRGRSKDNDTVSLLAASHWIESTSDNASSRINMNGMGILAETLLDELMEANEDVSGKVKGLRKKSRERKKEIAEERRSRALVGMSSFGPLAGAGTAGQPEESEDRSLSGVSRNVASSILAPVLDLFRDQSSTTSEATRGATAPRAAASESSSSDRAKRSLEKSEKPKWLLEMEAMEDETGLTCAVCQEGRTLQPTELLGLYTFVKKVSIPYSKGGGRGQIDGTTLLVSLPLSLPASLRGTHVDHEYFQPAKAVGDSLKSSSHASSNVSSAAAQSKRPSHFTTTVSAGNAIHCTCHAKARSADRQHPKAPKSEWEGASLRNSRVACNAILPLVSSKSSKVHLVAVEIALTDYQTVVSNMLGSRPKSMLWTVLHDIRFLLLRMSYGEALNADCGGGSLSSNIMLLFQQMFLADMFANDAEHDSPETAQHARYLSGGFLAAYEITNAEDFDKSRSSTAATLARSIADSAPMAALCCVLFNNGKDDDATVPGKERRWEMQKEKYLCGLLACAGRRHALGIDDSGCVSSRGGKRAARMRSSSFADWDLVDEDDEPSSESKPSSIRKPTSIRGKRSLPEIDDFGAALRPMITFYAIIDQLSQCFEVEMADDGIEKNTSLLVKTIEACQRTKSIHELLQKAKVTLDHEKIIEELQKGIVAA